jgi:integrase
MAGPSLYTRSRIANLPDLTTASFAKWITGPRLDGHPSANNTIRQRVSAARGFVAWLIDNGHLDRSPITEVTRYATREYPKVYGKRQDTNRARFLTYHEAYQRLVPACQDQTWPGSRDQLAIRLGLLGLRRTEILGLTWASYQHGLIQCTGKKHRIREVRPGPTLTLLLDRWASQYARQLTRPLAPNDPIICGQTTHHAGLATNQPRPIWWGHPLTPQAFAIIVARRAKLADLGHLSIHDLRRSAAAILHAAVTADGGHLYDLLDIQMVLDHSDPTTTQRSYLNMLDTAVKTRAGATLD